MKKEEFAGRINKKLIDEGIKAFFGSMKLMEWIGSMKLMEWIGRKKLKEWLEMNSIKGIFLEG